MKMRRHSKSDIFILNMLGALYSNELTNEYYLAKAQNELGVVSKFSREDKRKDKHKDDPYVHVHGIC